MRQAIAAIDSVDPRDVLVVTGAEALVILFFLAAEPGVNVVLPSPGFPTNMLMFRLKRKRLAST